MRSKQAFSLEESQRRIQEKSAGRVRIVPETFKGWSKRCSLEDKDGVWSSIPIVYFRNKTGRCFRISRKQILNDAN